MRGTSVLLCNYIWCPWACIVCIANGNQGAGPSRQFYIMGTIWISLLLLDSHFSILCDLARMCGAYWVIELPISSLFFKTQHRVPRCRRVSEVPSETARVQASKRKPYKDVRRRTLISARSAPRALVCHDARMPSSSQRYGVRRIDGYGRWHA